MDGFESLRAPNSTHEPVKSQAHSNFRGTVHACTENTVVQRLNFSILLTLGIFSV